MWEVPGSIPGVSSLFWTPKNFWQWWDSNPRPFRLVPKTSALDHSATLPTCYNLVNYHKCLFSSVVEHQSRKLGVVGSNPTGGNILSFEKLEKISSQLAGFEPTRAEPIGFQVQRLNHSATTAVLTNCHKKYVEMRGIEPRAFHMQSERSTTELHPLRWFHTWKIL